MQAPPNAGCHAAVDDSPRLRVQCRGHGEARRGLWRPRLIQVQGGLAAVSGRGKAPPELYTAEIVPHLDVRGEGSAKWHTFGGCGLVTVAACVWSRRDGHDWVLARAKVHRYRPVPFANASVTFRKPPERLWQHQIRQSEHLWLHTTAKAAVCIHSAAATSTQRDPTTQRKVN